MHFLIVIQNFLSQFDILNYNTDLDLIYKKKQNSDNTKGDAMYEIVS